MCGAPAPRTGKAATLDKQTNRSWKLFFRYVELAQLDLDGQRGAAEYLAEVRTRHDKCFAVIGLFLQRRAKDVGSRWDLTTSRDLWSVQASNNVKNRQMGPTRIGTPHLAMGFGQLT